MGTKAWAVCMLVLLAVIVIVYLNDGHKEQTFVIVKHETGASSESNTHEGFLDHIARIINGGKDRYTIMSGGVTIEATCAGEVLLGNPESSLRDDCENAPEVGQPVKMQRHFFESFQYLYYQTDASHAVKFLIISEEKQ